MFMHFTRLFHPIFLTGWQYKQILFDYIDMYIIFWIYRHPVILSWISLSEIIFKIFMYM